LSFINALRPRTFKYRTLGELPETFSAYEADSTEVFKNSNTNHGFIAQEVKAAIDADAALKMALDSGTIEKMVHRKLQKQHLYQC
jgi:hypothetical protein